VEKLVFAKHNYNGRTARKVRLVADLIRGKRAMQAVEILKFNNKDAAQDLLKVVNSAIANAVHNNNMNKENLIIVKVEINDAPVYKRGRAVSRGRYHEILKRNSHINIAVTDSGKVEKAVKSEAAKEKKAVRKSSPTKTK
jgi:large subunit ribosomal protein L22